MFNWFTDWFDRRCEEAWNRARTKREESSIKMNIAGLKVAESDIDDTGRMNFELTPAVGGYILNVSRRERSHSNGLVGGGGWNRTTYVLTKEDNLGERVAKILNLELIK
jgi:hypothetical protein